MMFLTIPWDGGLITQRVTVLLQYLGILTVVLMFLNGIEIFTRSKKYGFALLVCSLVLVVALVGLFVVHARLDAVIDVEAGVVTDRESFTIGHRRYNQFTTIQWVSLLVYLPVTIFAWRSTDATSGRDCEQ